MQAMGNYWLTLVTSSARTIKGKVELYTGSTLTNTYLATDKLANFKIEKTPKHGAFFGYSISQKATVELIDRDNTVAITKGDRIKPYIGTSVEYAKECSFIVEEAIRDEVRKTVTVTAYDLMNEAAKHKHEELTITFPITLKGYADAVAALLGTTVKWELVNDTFENIEYTETNYPNFEDTETLREVLEAIAQASGSICFINYEDKITFK
jgi:hypothetical protein